MASAPPSPGSSNPAPPVVGLTGGIGSGKSAVARLFLELGVPFVDADIVAREVVEPGEPALDRIANHFGQSVITSNGTLDRAALRQHVFADPSARQWLEQCLHPVIRERLVDQLRNAQGPYVLLVSPLLLETDQSKLCDLVLVVDVPVETQLDRTMRRDNNTREQVERIIAAQMPREQRRAKADQLIDNNQPLELVAAQVRDLHRQLLARFSPG